MKRILPLLNRFGMGRTIALVLLVNLALLRIWDPLPVEALRLRIFDAYQLIAPRVATQRPVVIIDIDEESLRALGQWPWPRTMVADMVTRVTQMGAVAIGFDVVFAEADRSSPALAADTFHGLDEETRAKLKALPSNDAVLAEAIGNSRVVLGQTALAQASAVPAEELPQTGFAVVGVRGVDVEPPLLEFPASSGTFRSSRMPQRGGDCSRSGLSLTALSGVCRSSCLPTALRSRRSALSCCGW